MDISAAWAALQAPAFSFAGAPASWLELLAFVLAIAMVVFNVREIHWGWPCAALSSVLYLGVFAQSRLYGDASLQLFFALMAAWGWWQWLRGVRDDGSALRIVHMPRSLLVRHLAITALLALGLGLFLKHFTDTDVPWWDAVPTAMSITATVWVARKYIENWPAWIVTNAIGISLYAYKGLWLTVLLYALLIVMAAWGWKRWLAVSKPQSDLPTS
jgi:nicotinamide mononucleotide transporter